MGGMIWRRWLRRVREMWSRELVAGASEGPDRRWVSKGVGWEYQVEGQHCTWLIWRNPPERRYLCQVIAEAGGFGRLPFTLDAFGDTTRAAYEEAMRRYRFWTETGEVIRG